MSKLSLLSLGIMIVLAGCAIYPETEFSRQDGSSLNVTGVIDELTAEGLQSALKNNEGIITLRLVNVPGSVDDQASLSKLVSLVQSNELQTLVPSSGIVASGGTDMALMGKSRIIEAGACIGVHSWGTSGLGGSAVGASVPRNDPMHQLYLSFYKRVGIPEEFYWFTLSSAGPDDIHWMSAEEINRFGLSDIPVTDTLQETVEQRRNRCSSRLN